MFQWLCTVEAAAPVVDTIVWLQDPNLRLVIGMFHASHIASDTFRDLDA